MPLIYGPGEMTNPQPKNFVTPSRTTGIYVQNVSPLALIITSGLGSIELPPWQTTTLEMTPNDNMAVSAIPITAVPPALVPYAYVDISYTFQGVTVQGAGLFFPFMTPGGNAVAAGIMGPDGLQVGTSTSNPNGSSLLVQATGSSAPLTAGAPVLVDTIAYGAFTASSVLLRKYTGVLHRNASTRLISVVSTIDQNFSSNPTFVMTDSSYLATNGYWGKGAMYNGGAGTPFNVITNNMASNLYNFFAASSTDDVTPDAVAYPADGFSLALPMGASLPTQGNVYVFVEEVF